MPVAKFNFESIKKSWNKSMLMRNEVLQTKSSKIKIRNQNNQRIINLNKYWEKSRRRIARSIDASSHPIPIAWLSPPILVVLAYYFST